MDGHHARLALIGRLLPAVSHDLNNPLTTISGFAQLIAARTGDAELRADASEIVEAAATASRYVEVLGQLARGSGLSDTDLAEAADAALTLAGHEMRAAGVEVAREMPDGPIALPGAGGPLLEATLHLLLDALDAVRATPGGRGGRRRIVVSLASDGETATLTVLADGAEPDARSPGLDRCRAIVEAQGGRLEHGPADGGAGARRIRLPLDARRPGS